MSSINQIPVKDISAANPLFSSVRSIIETAFYSNSVSAVHSVAEAYQLAKEAPETILTGLSIYHPEKLGLPADSNVLITNDGQIVGRTAAARKIIGQFGIDEDYYSGILREAAYQLAKRTCFSATVGIGLDEQFMLRSNLLIPTEYVSSLYSYLLNFQFFDSSYQKKYEQSTPYKEGDIFLLSDPDWQHPDFPNGLVLIDSLHNAAAVLGLRYFGELKKATLTLAWAAAHRNGFIACHGGMKQYQLPNHTYTMAAFGLSGSGKSTITLAKYHENQPTIVLHDDAFIISKRDGSSIALEPAYFDKTQDYPMADPAVTYFITCQNVGVTVDESGNRVLVTEDIRNGNGRTVKSALATPYRKNRLTEKIDAVFWIMKDDSLPPLVKIDDPILAALFGATLATKRSTAENSTEDRTQLVIEPFANPFRSYPLSEDYSDFKTLFQQGTACYILNTDSFNSSKITVEQTLHCIEQIVETKTALLPFSPIPSMHYLPVPEHMPDFSEQRYLNKLKGRLMDRLSFIEKQQTLAGGYNALPTEAGIQLKELLASLSDFSIQE